MTARFDFIVIGAGIAGTSAAALLAPLGAVLVLEQEAYPGLHATGRSAALFSEIYGNAPVRALSRASRSFLFDPPEGFAETAPVHPRGSLFIARADQAERLEAYARQADVAASVRLVDAVEAETICAALRPGYIALGVFEPGSVDIEVHELHQGYLRLLKRNGGLLRCDARVTRCEKRGALWHVEAGDEEYTAPVVINAAGAWADAIAALAGVAPLGLQPYRRTAALVDPPSGLETAHWPLVIDVDEEFYIKPDAGLLLVSPADEIPSPPCDAQPEELDVATGIHLAEQALALDVRRVKRSWAGLRTFAPDRSPVAGFDPQADGFFWLAGQGGYGIQTAPALARLTAALASHQGLPEDLAAAGVRIADLAPERMR